MKYLFFSLVVLFAINICAEEPYSKSSEFKNYKESLKTKSKLELTAEAAKNGLKKIPSGVGGGFLTCGAAGVAVVGGTMYGIIDTVALGLDYAANGKVDNRYNDEPYEVTKWVLSAPGAVINSFYTSEDSTAMKTYHNIEAIKEEWNSR